MPAVKPQIETMQNQSYINEYINKTLNPWKSSLLQTILSWLRQRYSCLAICWFSKWL